MKLRQRTKKRIRRFVFTGAGVVAVGATFLGWQRLGQPYGGRGLLAAEAVAVACWPLASLAVLFGLPALLLASVTTKQMRKSHRRRVEADYLADHPKADGYRPHIPALLRRAVNVIYGYRCVYCGQSSSNPQLDHIFPWSHGGITCLWNSAPLCKAHNMIKLDYWRYRKSGRVYYNGRDAATAAHILAVEKRKRLNPLRWIVGAWVVAFG